MDGMDIRVKDLWFSNDTLVIRAENKMFRVSKSILAARSSVFQDMFAFPPPVNDVPEILDDSAVVLHDSASDVEAFLRAIFDSSYFMPPPAVVETPVVLGILRLAHKYDVPYLYRRALSHLSERYFPLSVEEYRDYFSSQYLKEFTLGHRIAVIRAATQVGALWLLPVAYYLVSEYPATALRTWGEDDEIVSKCLAAKPDLISATSTMHAFLSTTSDEDCTKRNDCDAYRFQELRRYFARAADGGLSSPLEAWNEDDWSWHGFCVHCLGVARADHSAALRAFWERLPSLFGLPPWTELIAMQNAAFSAEEPVPL
ncbi:hypothetical protein B0H11DRAFT_436141 [Mycena galericulata]|nr:hypothetical protein B0H11DRAFT_436141 [Mycena galericulata]